jgi:hypothetical protein
MGYIDNKGFWHYGSMPRKPKPLTDEQKAQALENLREAREILSDKRAWTKGTLRRLNPDAEKELGVPAYQYCAIGAINKANHSRAHINNAKRVLAIALRTLFPRRVRANQPAESRIINFNDGGRTKHEQLLRAFDTAIELAQSDKPIIPPRIR